MGVALGFELRAAAIPTRMTKTTTAQATAAARRHIIERPRLTRLLDESTARVILLVAPAGYGKTTLARQWLSDRPHAWFEADTASGDVIALALGLSEALDQLSGESSRVAEAVKARPDLSDSLPELAAMQARCLEPWPADSWVVIDSYERLASSRASNAYIEALLTSLPVRLLVTTRRRPPWATPRRRLYGECLVMGRSALVMSDAEARSVLRGHRRSDIPMLISLAAGWPAVLGLASFAGETDFTGVLPRALYEFFAEELFKKASPTLRQALPTLALVSRITPQLAAAVLGPRRAPRLLAEAADLGFLTPNDADTGVHPLLRRFLISKFGDEIDGSGAADALIGHLVSSNEWDEAFDVIRTANKPLAIPSLLAVAHEPLLRSGRLATLSEWLNVANRLCETPPIVDLVRAELALRSGSASYAEQKALSAVQRSSASEIRCRGLCVAGRAAHLDNRGEDSMAHFREARTVAHSAEEKHRVAWGSLLTAQDREGDVELDDVLRDVLQHGTETPDDALRTANARLAIGLTTGGFPRFINQALAALRAFDDSADPVVLSSLLNSCGRSLSLLARYPEARDLANDEMRVALDANLTFVVPHAHLAQATALVGLGEYDQAREALESARECADLIDDRHNVFDAMVGLARLALAQGDFQSSLALTATRPSEDELVRGMYAEFTATRGLALACHGDADDAVRELSKAERVSSIPEVVALVGCGRAVLALQGKQENSQAAVELLDPTLESGLLDPLVITGRGFPTLISALRAAGRYLPLRLSRAVDITKGQQSDADGIRALTPRERQVADLLAAGYTNREIASDLVIAEVTAKVHVRRVLKKLGVRSRTEAAVAILRARQRASTNSDGMPSRRE